MRDDIKIVWLRGTTNTDYPLFHSVLLSFFPSFHTVQKFDIVHGHGYSAAPIAQKGIDVPILFHDHGSKEGYVWSVLSDGVIRGRGEEVLPQVIGFINNVYFDEAPPAGECDFKHMRRYDRVLATSSISLWDFRTRYLLTNATLFRHCIYDLVPPPPRKASPTPVVAVFAGELDSVWKCGTANLQKLLPLKDEIYLKLIGKGPAVGAWAKAHFPRVESTGHLPEKDAMDHLATADVLFEPSHHHLGLNLTGISALGLGVPIVAYTTGGHWDMVGADGDAGVLVDPMSGNVCGAIRKVLNNRIQYSKHAKARFKRMFSPKVCSENIRRIYEEAVR